MREELGQQGQVEAAVFVAEEDSLAVVAALGNVKRHIGDQDSIGSRHQLVSGRSSKGISSGEIRNFGL